MPGDESVDDEVSRSMRDTRIRRPKPTTALSWPAASVGGAAVAAAIWAPRFIAELNDGRSSGFVEATRYAMVVCVALPLAGAALCLTRRRVGRTVGAGMVIAGVAGPAAYLVFANYLLNVGVLTVLSVLLIVVRGRLHPSGAPCWYAGVLQVCGLLVGVAVGYAVFAFVFFVAPVALAAVAALMAIFTRTRDVAWGLVAATAFVAVMVTYLYVAA